jgi:four helix bundle protein
MFLNLAHTKLDVYQRSREFVHECYRISKYMPADERYAMTQQIRRAALSVHLNIAEGCSRKSPLERNRFMEISRGSLIEVDAALDIAVALEYFSLDDLTTLGMTMNKAFACISVMITANQRNENRPQ